MEKRLQDKKVVLLGGDDREVKLLTVLQQKGANLQVLGQPPKKVQSVEVISSLKEIDDDVEVVIAPMTGVDEEYKIKKTFGEQEIILTEEFFARFKPGTKFFIGFANSKIKEWCQTYQIDVIELAALDEVAILNAIPTVEGAIELAIRETPFTLHNNNSFVLGLGRVGLTLARMLDGLGSQTYGVARKAKDLARALEMGLKPVRFSNLAEEINKADVIFNTVPTLVLDEKVLQQVKSEAMIIDLASSPGGTDFKAAQKLNIKAELALGLPGKVAPDSAGEILGDVIPRLIVNS